MNQQPLDLRICFAGYDLPKVDDKKIFSLKKTVLMETKKCLEDMGLALHEIHFVYDEKKRPGLEINYFTDLTEQEFPQWAREQVYAIILKELQSFLQENFKENPKRAVLHSYSYHALPEKENTGGEKSEKEMKAEEPEEDNYIKKAAEKYVAMDPFYTFDHLIISQKTLDDIEISLAVLEHSELVFDKWGLKQIEPFPRAVLNFFGPPGTGKTLAAHAIADKLGKKLIIAGCPEIQSKYHGEGPKNVKAVFYAAEKSGAVLFFDEADSLLSKRLEEVSTGSEDEINNMRNAMLTCLECHKGIVIFASNFVQRYDYAFETRVQSILFPLPDLEALEKIWRKHFPSAIPVKGDICFSEIAETTLGFCGRDVKNAVIKACFTAVHKGQAFLTQEDILNACSSILLSRESTKKADYSCEPAVDKKEVKTPAELVREAEERWKNRYLNSVAITRETEIGPLLLASLELTDSEIKNAVLLSCIAADRTGSQEVSGRDILDTMKAFSLRKSIAEETGEESEEEGSIIGILQQMIDRYREK